MIFFTYFGVFTFIGLIILSFLTSRELKKQLPTESEKQLMVSLGLIQSDEKNKKVLRHQTQIFRTINISVIYCSQYPKLKTILNTDKKLNVFADNIEDKAVKL